MTELVLGPIDKVGAVALTARIRTAANEMWRLLEEAHARRAWEALGYKSFRDYLDHELDMSKSQAYRLLAKATVVKTLAASHAGDTAVEDAVAEVVPARRAEEIQEALPAVRKTATAARKRARAKGATVPEAAAAGARAAIAKLPVMEPPAAAPDADRARRAAEYAARTGRPAAAPRRATPPAAKQTVTALHCPTCRCAGEK